jgi:hypothetical protein
MDVQSQASKYSKRQEVKQEAAETTARETMTASKEQTHAVKGSYGLV